MEAIGKIDVRDYYSRLTKKEKSKLLEYLMVKYGYNYTTIRVKLTGVRARLKRNEELDVQEAINNESIWRR